MNPETDKTTFRSSPSSPRWRGFNLPNLCFPPGDFRFADMVIQGYGRFFENEFRWIAEWGFNFVRLPISYDWYVLDGDPELIDEGKLAVIDQAIEWGERYGLHVNLGLVHAPGYVNGSDYWLTPDRFDLWKDAAAAECFNAHWQMFARRYRGRSALQLSFCLLAEPARTDADTYARIIRGANNAVLAADPGRPILVEGLEYGSQPVPQLADVGAAHCCRAYQPFHISHQLAWWVHMPVEPPAWPTPKPVQRTGWLVGPLDPDELRAWYQPWIDLAKQGVPRIHCGETGFWSRTPHHVGLAWIESVLTLFKEFGWSWALWNFTGAFGILDSGRTDVSYEHFHGHLLDRKYLQLLQRY
ncbi:MAG TPA: cellulase family glycosylhydrolase [Verrucomicrobiae bacterium]|nr:cellulase family glycosylhydrolase [Verrucomicrobiae bacterium]